jgi:hypothetical protein
MHTHIACLLQQVSAEQAKGMAIALPTLTLLFAKGAA